MEAFPAKNVLTGCEVDQLWRPLCIHVHKGRRQGKEGGKGRKGRQKNRVKRGKRERREGGKTARKRGELEINVVLQV